MLQFLQTSTGTLNVKKTTQTILLFVSMALNNFNNFKFKAIGSSS